MTEEESWTRELSGDLAKNLARMHGVSDLPFEKPGFDLKKLLQYILPSKDKKDLFLKSENLKSVHEIAKYD